jgi:hypothetical protein
MEIPTYAVGSSQWWANVVAFVENVASEYNVSFGKALAMVAEEFASLLRSGKASPMGLLEELGNFER